MENTNVEVCGECSWLVNPIWILLKHEDNKGHGLLWVYLDLILTTVKVVYVILVENNRIKVKDYLGLFGVYHEDPISNVR